MGRFSILSFALLALVILIKCKTSQTNSFTIEIINPSPVEIVDGEVELPISQIVMKLKNLEPEKLVLFHDEKEIASQLITPNDNIDEAYLLTLVNIAPNSSIYLNLKQLSREQKTSNYKKRTQAEISVKDGGKWEWGTKKNGTEQFEYKGGEFKNIEYLKVPEQHTDHSFYIRYEGPGWESDKVGYRFYLDWRNAVDIYGKLTSEMVLQNVGLDGFESYHQPADWGQDIFKVGSTLGIGSIGFWDGDKAVRVDKTDSIDCQIRMNGNLKSEIVTNYYGWQIEENKININSKISIVGGSRLSKQALVLNDSKKTFCTGIIKYKGIEPITNLTDSITNWIYLATYGKQSLADDSLGLAIIVNKKYLETIRDDNLNHIAVLKALDNKLSYFFLATWEQEKNGVKTRKDFINYLNEKVETLNKPLQIHWQ